MMTSVRDASQIGEARRKVAEFMRRLGAGEQEAGRAALIATELATNLVKHAGGGDLLIEEFADHDGAGLELMALDKGGGMDDLQRCLGDGFSSSGSPGTGLGAIGRQASRFAIFSRPGLGTVLMARLAFSSPPPEMRGVELGAHMICYPGETVSGDRWAFANPAAGPTLLMVDGTGHGPGAAAAADLAVEIFRSNAGLDCERLAEALHRGLTPTRGAALALARFDRPAGMVRFVGIGNIAGAVASAGGLKRTVSHNGTAGHIAPRIRCFDYPVIGDPLILLHSDGLTAKWDLAAYPGLLQAHASLVAGILFRDHRRGRDDASVVAMRVVA
jgi:anti-sigma regulatory factor (Ser/Thr protein kinase)